MLTGDMKTFDVNCIGHKVHNLVDRFIFQDVPFDITVEAHCHGKQ